MKNWSWRELGVVTCCLAGLALLVPGGCRAARAKAEAFKCVNQQRAMALAFKVFANDNDDLFPYEMTNSLAYDNSREAWLHFQTLSNELGTPKVLMCPADHERESNMASVWGPSIEPKRVDLPSKGNRAVSYFVGIRADESIPSSILLGDRDVEAPAERLDGRVLRITRPSHLRFTGRLHPNWGYVAMADGSVQQFTEPVQKNYPGTNLLLLPLFR